MGLGSQFDCGGCIELAAHCVGVRVSENDSEEDGRDARRVTAASLTSFLVGESGLRGVIFVLVSLNCVSG